MSNERNIFGYAFNGVLSGATAAAAAHWAFKCGANLLPPQLKLPVVVVAAASPIVIDIASSWMDNKMSNRQAVRKLNAQKEELIKLKKSNKEIVEAFKVLTATVERNRGGLETLTGKYNKSDEKYAKEFKSAVEDTTNKYLRKSEQNIAASAKSIVTQEVSDLREDFQFQVNRLNNKVFPVGDPKKLAELELEVKKAEDAQQKASDDKTEYLKNHQPLHDAEKAAKEIFGNNDPDKHFDSVSTRIDEIESEQEKRGKEFSEKSKKGKELDKLYKDQKVLITYFDEVKELNKLEEICLEKTLFAAKASKALAEYKESHRFPKN